MSNKKFEGLLDSSGYEIDFVEFNSPVWTGTGYAAGITVSRSSAYPTDRPRCAFAEIVSENWRFVMGGKGAVLVSNSNIKFIWTVGTEISSGKSQYHEESVGMPEALSHIGQPVYKVGFGAHNPNSTALPESEPVSRTEAVPMPAPDPTAHFEVANPPTPPGPESENNAEATEPTEAPKKRRGRPPGAKNKNSAPKAAE